MASSALALIILWVLVFGFVSASIWSSRGGAWGIGFVLGALLGFIGLLFVAFATPRTLGSDWRRCPRCLEAMRAGATTCPHCHERSSPYVAEAEDLGESETGTYSLILRTAGDDPKKVAERLEEVASLGRREALDLAHSGPVLILEGLSLDYANVLKASLEEVGATAEVLG